MKTRTPWTSRTILGRSRKRPARSAGARPAGSRPARPWRGCSKRNAGRSAPGPLMLLRARAAGAVGYRPLGILSLFGLFGAVTAHALVIELSHFRPFWMLVALLAAAAAQADWAIAT